jgi:hypothetical protein
LFILGHNLVLCLKIIIIDDLNSTGLRVPKEALVVLEEVSGKDTDFGHKAFGLDGYCQHVLTNALKVNNQDHVIGLREAWDEFESDLGLTILLESTTLVGDVELVLHISAAISWNSNNVVDLNI